jgi:hypothetical protein
MGKIEDDSRPGLRAVPFDLIDAKYEREDRAGRDRGDSGSNLRSAGSAFNEDVEVYL